VAKAKNEDEAEKLRKGYLETLELRQTVSYLDDLGQEFGLGKYSELADKKDSESIATRKLIAKLSVYEHKLTYLLANSSKFEDRLTQKDVEAARKKISLFSFVDKPVDILERYKSIRSEIQSVFDQNEQNYLANGGTRGFILGNFENMPSITKYKRNQTAGASKQKVLDQNVDTVAGNLITAGQAQWVYKNYKT